MSHERRLKVSCLARQFHKIVVRGRRYKVDVLQYTTWFLNMQCLLIQSGGAVTMVCVSGWPPAPLVRSAWGLVVWMWAGLIP